MESIEKALNGELYPSAYPASHGSCVCMCVCMHLFGCLCAFVFALGGKHAWQHTIDG